MEVLAAVAAVTPNPLNTTNTPSPLPPSAIDGGLGGGGNVTQALWVTFEFGSKSIWCQTGHHFGK